MATRCSKRLRGHPATAHIPVIAVSADAKPADIQRARDAGFVGYLCKPLDLDLALEHIQGALAALPRSAMPAVATGEALAASGACRHRRICPAGCICSISRERLQVPS